MSALGLALMTAVTVIGATPAASAPASIVTPAEAAPVITLQPQDGTAVEFTDVTLTAASDDPAATVLWGVSLDGGDTWFPFSSDDPAGTQTSYTFEAVSSRDAWLYHAVFTNDLGSTVTRAAKIDVSPATPMVNLQPQSETVVAGQLTNLYARAWTLHNDHTMQWQVDAGSGTFVDLPGDRTQQESLAFEAAYADSGNRYRALFTSAGGTTASDAAVLTVTASVPTVRQNPQDQYVTIGDPATFEAGGSGDPLPSAQWQRAEATGPFTDLPGETGSTLTLMPTIEDDHARFRAVFTNPAGTVTGDPAELRVWIGPVLTSTPQDQTVARGESALFTVHATGNPAPGIRWQVSIDENASWTDVPGATDGSYSTGPTTAADSGHYYRAIVSNYGGVVVTANAVLTVTPAAGPSDPTATEPDDETEAAPVDVAPVTPVAELRPVTDVRAAVDETTTTSGAEAPAASDPTGLGAEAALPRTGTDARATSMTGALGLGVGALLVLAGRRRRTG